MEHKTIEEAFKSVEEYYHMRYYLEVSIINTNLEEEIMLNVYLYKSDEVHLMADKIKELSKYNSEETSVVIRVSYEPV